MVKTHCTKMKGKTLYRYEKECAAIPRISCITFDITNKCFTLYHTILSFNDSMKEDF